MTHVIFEPLELIKEVDRTGFDGALVRDMDSQKGIVLVKASTREESRKRFTVAHEIGHFVISTHKNKENLCAGSDLESWSDRLVPTEIEANEFAVEFLLPNKLVKGIFPQSAPSLTAIGKVAATFQTSLTATLRRFLGVTDLACAMVWIEKERTWMQRSKGFGAFIRLDEIPFENSLASRLLKGQSVPDSPAEVEAGQWLNERDAEGVSQLFEHSIHLKNYGAVLTLLWIRREKE
jgi:Zn-dependent peptidase ImmA (M78 family)